jgi:putative endonuclease
MRDNSVTKNMPCTTTLKMYTVYVLESIRDGKRYIGYTENLRKRLADHRKGKVFSTKSRLPLTLIYFESCTNKEDAMRREAYLKTTGGNRFLAKRLKAFYYSKL